MRYLLGKQFTSFLLNYLPDNFVIYNNLLLYFRNLVFASIIYVKMTCTSIGWKNCLPRRNVNQEKVEQLYINKRKEIQLGLAHLLIQVF